jgi:hypothetical protein
LICACERYCIPWWHSFSQFCDVMHHKFTISHAVEHTETNDVETKRVKGMGRKKDTPAYLRHFDLISGETPSDTCEI